MNADPVLAWQARNLSALKRLSFKQPCSSDVTLITAWLWCDERFDSLLDSLLAAILMTWRFCGRLPVVLLVNRETPALLNMAQEWGLRLLVEPQIQGGGGNVKTLNREAIMNLPKRFDTEYLLSFQNHAFPIREGLNDFLGKYDYIGAPWVFGKDDWITRFLLHHRGDVGNGAFSIKSRQLCEMTAWYYERKYKYLPHCYLVIDDYFIGKTLPSFEKRYRETIRIASPAAAATFSLEDNVALHESIHANPFGFHGPRAFSQLLREGKVPDLSSDT
ncbi:MAG TPA: DUF5672 family protein [Kiritimatiellia bacterium]|nr:DUF5672 family protein [Kiritimatiellia bacterium]HPS07020.1 DUF5672 family protein [Kiritimatiellia bacterium]